MRLNTQHILTNDGIKLVNDLLALARYCATHNVGTNLEKRAQRLVKRAQ